MFLYDEATRESWEDSKLIDNVSMKPLGAHDCDATRIYVDKDIEAMDIYCTYNWRH